MGVRYCSEKTGALEQNQVKVWEIVLQSDKTMQRLKTSWERAMENKLQEEGLTH